MAEKIISDKELQVRFSVLDYIRECVAVIDKTGRIVFINKAISDNWGYGKEEFLGKRFQALNIVTPKSMVEVMAVFTKRIIGSTEATKYDIEIKTKDNRTRMVEVEGLPFKMDGKVFGVIVTLLDRTDEKRGEEELGKRNTELEKFYKVAVGRETRIVELKNKVAELESKLKKLQ